MKRKIILLAMVIVLLAAAINALPVPVSVQTYDSDTMYGNNDPGVHILSRWNQNNYTVAGNVTEIEAGVVAPVAMLNNGDGTYTLNYTIVLSAADGNKTIRIIAAETGSGLSVVQEFNVTLDNVAPVFSNLDHTPHLIFNVTDAIINATIYASFLDPSTIIVIGSWNGSLQNFTPQNHTSEWYYEMSHDFINDGESVSWTWYASDRAGNLANSGAQNFSTTFRTQIQLIPPAPTGLDHCYNSSPFIIFTPDPGSSGQVYYRTNSHPNQIYSGAFNVTDMNTYLHWFLNITFNASTSLLEPSQNITLFVDTTRPIGTNLYPANQSTIANARPNISVELTDINNFGSGVNWSMVRMFFNGVDITAFTGRKNNLIYFYPSSNLSDGVHAVNISLIDECGNANTFSWTFTVETTTPINMIVQKPQNMNYNTPKISLLVTTQKNVSLYASIDAKSPVLYCSECMFLNRTITFADGSHSLNITARNGIGNTETQIINFFVDATDPIIHLLMPADGTIVTGTNLSMKYSEENVQIVTLYYGVNVSDNATRLSSSLSCLSGKNQFCGQETDLTAFAGQEVEFQFFIEDIAGNQAWSDITTLSVDTSTPVITVNQPQNIIYNSRRIPLDVVVSENVLLSMIINEGREQRLCSSCDAESRIVTLNDGNYNMTFIAEDGAGHRSNNTIAFSIDANPPKITKTSPAKDSKEQSLVNFTVTYKEENVQQVTLTYGLNASDPLTALTVPLICPSGTNMKCSIVQDLSVLNNNNVEYFFTIEDSAGSMDISKITTFSVDASAPIFLSILEPTMMVYGTRNVPIILTLSEPVTLKASVNGARQRVLCTKCGAYNKSLSLRDGEYNITLEATDPSGFSTGALIPLSVDSTPPNIIKMFPRDKAATQGIVNFTVIYTENNLQSALLKIWNQSNLVTMPMVCQSGTKQSCSLLVDLSAFHGITVNYQFELGDVPSTAQSKIQTLTIDNMPPIFTLFSPINASAVNGTSVPISFLLDEKAMVTMAVDADAAKKLCSSCDTYNAKRTFSLGNHTIIFTAEDKVGNSVQSQIAFTVQ